MIVTVYFDPTCFSSTNSEAATNENVRPVAAGMKVRRIVSVAGFPLTSWIVATYNDHGRIRSTCL